MFKTKRIFCAVFSVALCINASACSLLASALPTSGMLGGSGSLETLMRTRMPDLKGLSRESAEQRLLSAGFLGQTEWNEKECGSDHAPGTVCGSMPGAGLTLAQGTVVEVSIQKARAADTGPAAPRSSPATAVTAADTKVSPENGSAPPAARASAATAKAPPRPLDTVRFF